MEIVYLETVEVGNERDAHCNANVVRTVVHAFQQIWIHVVQLILVEAVAKQREEVTKHAHCYQARALVVILHRAAHAREEVVANFRQLQYTTNTNTVLLESGNGVKVTLEHYLS